MAVNSSRQAPANLPVGRMAKFRSSYVCQNCGAITQRWAGKCESCGEWNTIIEEAAALGVGRRGRRAGGGQAVSAGRPVGRLHARAAARDRHRRTRPGRGRRLRPGSATLIGGEPGIGKSTLLIQACAASRAQGAASSTFPARNRRHRCVCAPPGSDFARRPCSSRRKRSSRISWRRSARATRRNSWSSIPSRPCGATRSNRRPDGQPGARLGQALIRFAKASDAALLLVGHVTKDGQIAGPRVVEHMVDAVFSFEGDGAHAFRLLRATKNRFGATDEVGVFEMTGGGLPRCRTPPLCSWRTGTARPSGGRGLRGSRRGAAAPGRDPGFGRAVHVRHAAPRGCRLGAEPAGHGARGARGPWGLKLGQYDVYLNVAGGLRIAEPAADLAVAAALISSLTGASLPRDAVYFGEIGLSGWCEGSRMPA